MKDYTARTNEEIFNIARDMIDGHIFSSFHLRRLEDATCVFMPLIFLDEETSEIWKDDPPGVIYKYVHKAMPRSVNGMPSFMSFHFLDSKDTERLRSMIEKLQKHDEELKRQLTGESDEDSNSDSSSCDASEQCPS